MEPHYQPWEKKTLTDEQLQILYREWGLFYSKKQKVDIAAKYYDISLDLKNDDPKALYSRSRCKRNITQTAEALLDAQKATEIDPMSQPYNLEVCDALYQLNAFEDSKVQLYQRSSNFHGLKLEGFFNRHDIINVDFKASLGEPLKRHILEDRKYFMKAYKKRIHDETIDNRPLWKILKENSQCDVLSVLEKEEELLSPREKARRHLALKNFMQIYMRRSWVDMLFFESLKSNPSLLLQQSNWSTPSIKDITNKKFNSAILFLKMLHARSPLYAKKLRKCAKQQMCEQVRMEHLFRIQYQVHRNMVAILKTSAHLRKSQKLQKLTKYIEETMSKYVVLKTHRVMPWKFEFINEVYNILALAHIDNYLDIPNNLDDYPTPNARFTLLLKMPLEKARENVIFKFGDRSTYQDPELAEIPMIKHRKFLSQMENRLLFAKHSIERSYIYHEMAASHLKNFLTDECCLVAQKLIDESHKCNSLVWNLLGLLLICKSHYTLHKIERIRDTLSETLIVARRLKDEKVVKFIELLEYVNNEELADKKMQEGYKKFKSSSMIMKTSRGSEEWLQYM